MSLRILGAVLAILLGVTGVAKAAGVQTPGSTELSFSASPDGAASFTIPLKVPPGTGGLEPKFSLVYSSRGGPSAFGYGWSLSGLSSIQRGPRNLRDDGVVSGIALTADDALYLDGEKLIEVPSQTPNAREFRTRIDSISRVRAYEADALGPGRLVVETRAGLIMAYGSRAESRVALQTGQTLMWLCDRITDRSGNYMEFHYEFDTSGGSKGLDYRISSVAYTGNTRAALAPYAELKFNYKTTTPYGSRYVLGQRAAPMSVLDSIVSTYQGRVLRRYTPTFTTPSGPQIHYTLASLTEEGANGGHYRPLTFTYSTVKPNWVPRDLMKGIQDLPDLGDVSSGVKAGFRFVRTDAAGRPGLILSAQAGAKSLQNGFRYDATLRRWAAVDKLGPPVRLGGEEGPASGVAVEDVDGDGVDDLLSSPDQYNNPSATFVGHGDKWAAAGPAPPIEIREGSLRRTGLLQVELYDTAGVRRRGFVWDFRTSGGQHERGAAYWDGTKWKDRGAFAPPHSLSSVAGERINGAMAIDVDCDGLPELVYHQSLSGGGVRSLVYRSTPTGWQIDNTPALKIRFAPPPTDAAYRAVDVNADGFLDLVLAFDGSAGRVQEVWTASTNGWQSDNRKLPDLVFWTTTTGSTSVDAADLDGDRIADVFDAGAVRIAYQGGAGDWTEEGSLTPPTGIPDQTWDRGVYWRLVSLDGDARPEWLDLRLERTRLTPDVYSHTTVAGWKRDVAYSVPLDIAAFDKVDLGIRFMDLNGDGYADLTWSRRKNDGSTDEAAYIFQPGASDSWRKDDRYILPKTLLSEDYKDTGVLMADVNGDGLVDVVSAVRENGADNLDTFVNCTHSAACKAQPPTTKSAFWTSVKATPNLKALAPPEAAVDTSKGPLGVRLMDMNGDGLTDFVVSRTEEREVDTTPAERARTGRLKKPVYELYARTYLNVDGEKWLETARFRLPVALVRPVVRDAATGSGDDAPFQGYSVVDTAAQLFDVNNDRLADVIYNYEAWEFREDANGRFVPTVVPYQGASLSLPGGWSAVAAYKPPHRLDPDKAAEKRQLLFEDLNGDGYTDLAFANGGSSETFLNTAIGWTPAADAGYQIPAAAIRDSKSDQGFRFLDVNGDGLPDIVYHWATGDAANPKKGSFLNTGLGWTTGPVDAAPPVPFAEEDRGDTGIRPLDLNGDGLLDVIQAYKRSASETVRTVYVNETDRPYMLQTATSGMGLKTTITYRSFLAYQYAAEKKASPLRAVRSSPDQERLSAYPIIHAPLPGYLVTEVRTEGPGVARRSSGYRYDGYRVDVLSGRSLGFEQRAVLDLQRDSVTWFEYFQDDALIGNTKRSYTLNRNRKTAETVTNWTVVSSPGAPISTPQGPFVPAILKPLMAKSVAEAWDLNGKLLSSTTVAYAYDGHTNPTSVRTTYADLSGSLALNSYADDEATWSLARLTRAQVTLFKSGAPPITREARFAYDGATGLMTSETAFATSLNAKTTTYARDVFGNKTAVVTARPDGSEARGQTFAYDAQGRFPVSVTNQLQHRATSEHDPVSGVVTLTRDANGIEARQEYDDLQRETAAISPTLVRKTTSLAFPGAGDSGVAIVMTVSVPGLPPMTSFIDAAGRVTKLQTLGWQAQSIVSETRYDGLGRLEARSLPHLPGAPPVWATTRYDDLDRPVLVTATNGAKIQTTYDGLRTTTLSDLGQTTTRVVDFRGRAAEVIDASGKSTRFEYDAAGRLAATTNVLNQRIEQDYDDLGRRIALRDPVAGAWSYGYSLHDEPIYQRDPTGRETRTRFDVLGRPYERVTGTDRATWTYDTGLAGLGRVASSTSGPGRLRTYTYDRFGRLAQGHAVIGKDSITIVHRYDALNRQVSRSYSTGIRVTNRYDGQGFWRSIRVRDGDYDREVYRLTDADLMGRITAEGFGNGVTSVHNYDPGSGRLVRATSKSLDGVQLQDLFLTYDAVGNVKTRKDTAAGLDESFQYDQLNRLIQATGVDAQPIDVQYDDLGNIKTKAVTGSYQYCDRGAQLQLLCSVTRPDGSRIDLTYDAAGRVVTNGDQTVLYDDSGRVREIREAGGLGPRTKYSSFTYGADGEVETQASRDGLTAYRVSYLGDVELLREDFTPPHTPTSERTRVRHFITGPSGTVGFYEKAYRHFPYRFVAPSYGALATEKPERVTDLRSGFVYFLRDHLGSTSVILDEDGKVLQRLRYDPWGKRLGPDAGKYHSVRRGFTGHEHLDHLDLIVMGGRVYSPELGRFLSPDIVTQAPLMSQSYNRYSYVLNNPLRLVDPTGFGWLSDAWNAVTGGAGAILGGVASIVDAAVGKPLAWVGEQIAKGGRWLQQNWRVVVIIAATVALGPVGTTLTGAMLAGAAVGGLSAALYGGSAEDILKGAALGAVTAGAFYGVGSAAISNEYLAAGAHGMVGGVTSVMRGENFAAGFMSAAVTKYAGSYIDPNGGTAYQVTAAAVVGGVASEVGGGSFENGAITGAFSRLFNDVAHPEEVAARQVASNDNYEVIVVINDNAALVGTHAGVWLSDGQYSDPGGSYEPHIHGETLKDYVALQVRDDGPDVRLYRFKLSKSEFSQLSEQMTNNNRGMPFFCATNVQRMISGIGPFKAIEPPRFTTPRFLSWELKEAARTQGGSCKMANGDPCN